MTTTAILGNMIHITKNNATDPAFGIELPRLPTDRVPWAIENGEEIHSINLRGNAGTEFEIKTNATVQIAFEKIGTFEREPVIPVLHKLCDGVERAIQTFSSCF
jgi:hypothetical protein